MSSSVGDSSDEIDNKSRKKICKDNQKLNGDGEIKEEYQDLVDEGEDIDDGDKDQESGSQNKINQKSQKSTNDKQNGNCDSNSNEKTTGRVKKNIEIKPSYTFHNNNPNHIITNEINDVEWECFDCNKKYKSYPAFYTHNKIKHNGNPPDSYKIPRPLDSISKDRGRPKADTSKKQKFTDKDQRQHNLEDQIYEFLAKAGANDDQDNKIIRQYLNEPVNYIDAIPNFLILDTNIKENIRQIKQELKIYIKYQLIKEQKFKNIVWNLIDLIKQYDDYQFIDPMELSDLGDHEINLFNLKYLTQYYQQNNLLNEYSLISIFIAWIGKELRLDSYQELTYITIAYFTAYMNEVLKVNKDQASYEVRRDILEKVHKNMEYSHYLSGFQFNLFNTQQMIYDLVGQIKLWMTLWIEIQYSDGINQYSSKFNSKQEAIVLGSDDEEESEDEDEDGNDEEEEEENIQKTKKQRNNTQKLKKENSQKQQKKDQKSGNKSLENPEQQNKIDQSNKNSQQIQKNDL